MLISDWSSVVCSTDVVIGRDGVGEMVECADRQAFENRIAQPQARVALAGRNPKQGLDRHGLARHLLLLSHLMQIYVSHEASASNGDISPVRSEEHTSELQSLMRISYAVFCLKKKKHTNLITRLRPQLICPTTTLLYYRHICVITRLRL